MKLYRTRTQEEFDWLMQRLEDEGYAWVNGNKPTEKSYETYKKILLADKMVVSVHGQEKLISNPLIKHVREYETIEVSELMKPKTDAEIMKELIEGRNNKAKSVERPTHYENNGKDLFDELYERFYHSKKMFTGREVVIIVMKFVAERYVRRYPNKNPEDLSKGIYTLERLKEYEENEK